MVVRKYDEVHRRRQPIFDHSTARVCGSLRLLGLQLQGQNPRDPVWNDRRANIFARS